MVYNIDMICCSSGLVSAMQSNGPQASRSSVILTALVIGETKALLEPVTGVVIVEMLSGKELKA